MSVRIYANDRLDFLSRHPPRCAACDHEQIQLMDYFHSPAEWRCRICKHRFTFEPDGAPPFDPVIQTKFVFAPEEIDLSGIGLPIWTVYDRPKDFPDKFIVRLFDGTTGHPTAFALSFDTIEQVQDTFIRWHFLWRQEADDPKIVGTFI
jgi:hypothetical protein